MASRVCFTLRAAVLASAKGLCLDRAVWADRRVCHWGAQLLPQPASTDQAYRRDLWIEYQCEALSADEYLRSLEHEFLQPSIDLTLLIF